VIDTHAHLAAEADEVLARASAAGVDRVIGVATTVEEAAAILELAERHEGVYACLGIHPHEAGGAEADRVLELRDLLRHPKAVAVGETGLDYFRDYAPHDAQRRLFEQQRDLALELGLSIVIHTRDADDDTAAALLAHVGPVVLHCFSSPGLLDAALERGWYVSFAGNVTYPSAGDLRDAARRVAADRLLAETDSPFLAPQPVRGRRNEPAHVVHVVDALAAARDTDPLALAAQIDANAAAAFGLP